MNERITKKQLALGTTMLYGALIGTLAVINQPQAMMVVVMVGGVVVAWSWMVASRKN